MAAKKAKPSKGFSAAERAAMKERARELKAEARASKDKAAGEQAVLATIAAMPAADRALGERLHAIVTASGPALWPKLWYGMPAYANPPPLPRAMARSSASSRPHRSSRRGMRRSPSQTTQSLTRARAGCGRLALGSRP